MTDRDLFDAIEFYRTPRGYDEHSTNRRYFTNLAPMIGFDPFHMVGELLIQPVEVIVAGRLGTTFSFSNGQTLFEKATNRQGFHIIDGAGHYDMYDKELYIKEAVDKLDVFFRVHLKGRS